MDTSRIGNRTTSKPRSRLSRVVDTKGADRPSRVRRLSNVHLAELLARQAEHTPPPINRALRRASRRAFIWPEEASLLLKEKRSLTELQGIGPYLEKVIREWVGSPPPVAELPALRAGFLTFTEAKSILAERPDWLSGIKGDLQMHSLWSDGTASIGEMAAAAAELDYEYIAITDHAKGLKIAGGIDEAQLQEQGAGNPGPQPLARKRGKEAPGIAFDRTQPQSCRRRRYGAGCARKTRHRHRLLSFVAAAEGGPDGALSCRTPQSRNPDPRPSTRTHLQLPGGLVRRWPRVFALAAELDKAVEIDAYPDRQDLSPDLLVHAKKAHCRISFGTDSHGPTQLRFMVYAAASALRAGIATRPHSQFHEPGGTAQLGSRRAEAGNGLKARRITNGTKEGRRRSMADPFDLPPLDGNGKIQVVIETPKGSRNKYSFDPELRIFSLKKVLPAGMTFPYDFGFVPSTKAEDGDPTDVLVLMDEPAFPGCLLKCRIIGIIEGQQGKKQRASATTASSPSRKPITATPMCGTSRSLGRNS